VHATSIAHLRQLLAADHRYVFTLIDKFRPDKGLFAVEGVEVVGASLPG